MTDPNGGGYDIASSGGQYTQTVEVSADDTVISATPTRLARILVIDTGATSMEFYDNATEATGTIVGKLIADPVIGSVTVFDMPCKFGLTAKGDASNPLVVVSYW